MTISLNELAGAVHLWATTTHTEISHLAFEVRALGNAFGHKWRTDPVFRSSVLKAIGHALGAAALRGPRATVLWAASAVGQLLTILARLLDGEAIPSPAR